MTNFVRKNLNISDSLENDENDNHNKIEVNEMEWNTKKTHNNLLIWLTNNKIIKNFVMI